MHIPIRKDMILRHHGRIFIVEDVHERHSGQQKPTVHAHLRDLMDGHHVDRTLDELMPLQEVAYSYRTLRYSYSRSGDFVFMDTQTYDEHEIAAALLKGFEPFLGEGQEFRVMFVDERPVLVDFPPSVALHVTTTAAPERSVGSGGSVLKEAELENGLTVRVPLFIKNGDLIRVNTRDRTYAGKEKEEHK